jgi:FAD/FMN-containing dehydrogenase
MKPLDFAALADAVGDRLLEVGAPLGGASSEDAFARLRNPYAIEEDPAAFHTTGWHGGHVTRHSSRAVAAQSAADIAAAVNFAREHGMGLVIKGTGHDYLGRSSDPEALLIWTHRMRDVTVHDAFVPTGSSVGTPAVPAITVGAGTRWLEAYQALLPSGRYVQGGGCLTVGAAGGFTQGGGFGSLSRRYGTAAGNVLEAEVITASGEILTVNACQHPDLFWALRGGGGGTFGVVSRLTMRTHRSPQILGQVAGSIAASGDAEFRRLIERLVLVMPDLCDDRWGEYIMFTGFNTAEFGLLAADVTEGEAGEVWAPFLEWIAGQPAAYRSSVSVRAVPFVMWDHAVLSRSAPDSICHDDRAGAPADRFWRAGNQFEVSWYLHSFQSRWLPRGLLNQPDRFADALFRASRPLGVRLDFNKALGGAAAGALARDRDTAINPAVFGAAALAFSASWQQYAFPGVPGHEPDPNLARDGAARVTEVMDVIREVAPEPASYVNETDYFEDDWQRSFWGANYGRLLEIKRKYDPGNIFRVHHGVGSEA